MSGPLGEGDFFLLTLYILFTCTYITYSLSRLPHTAIIVFGKDNITTSYLKLNTQRIKHFWRAT